MKQIGLIGLGKMGFNLIQNIKNNGFEPIGFDVNNSTYDQLSKLNINTAKSVDELIKQLPKPCFIILMVPSGKITEECFNQVLEKLSPGDCIIDAGNSHYQDSIRRYELAKSKSINFVDCGTSGGTSGALNGACLMVGGDNEIIQELNYFFTKIAIKDGYLHTGKPGSGHFCKMIHNGIEYGMMQSIAEGYEILESSPFDYDYTKVSKMWNNGSVIRSWLIELMIKAFSNDSKLDKITGIVEMNGEGLWAVEQALQQGTPAPTIALSVMMRQRSQQKDTFAGKVVAVLRNSFGGHKITKK